MAIGMANTVESCSEKKLRSNVGFILEMINLSTDRLEGLRTHCNSNVVLTKQEIRTLETKLVKMFSELLIAKAKLPGDQSRISQNAMELKLWLRVVGLSGESLNTVIHRVNSLEALLYKNDNELRAILNNNSNSDVRAEEIRRLIRALRCLKDCQAGRKEQSDLFWDSWDRQAGTSPRTGHKVATKNHRHHSLANQSQILPEQNQSPVETSPPQQLDQMPNNAISPEEGSFHTLTPSPSPPNSPSFSLNNKSKVKGFITTPPPRKKHQTLVSTAAMGTPPPHSNSNYHSSSLISSTSLSNNNPAINGGVGSYDQNSLTKSRSHEFQHNKQHQLQLETPHQQNVSNNSDQSMPIITNGIQHPTTIGSGPNHNSTTITTSPNFPTPRTRLHTEPDPDHTTDLGDNITSNNLIVPRSPCTPIIIHGAPPIMGHMIQHRFTKKFKMTSSTCDLCNKQMFFGFKCTECKYRCHKDCKSNVPPSCGLPQEFVDEFKKKLNDGIMPNTSPSLGRNLMPNNRREKPRMQAHNIQSYHGPDSSSAGSSCNSSSPSSPALLASCIPPQTPATTSNRSQFNFPEITNSNNTNASAPPTYISNGVPEIEIREEQTKEKDNSTSMVKHNLSELSDTHRSNDSDKTVSLTGSTSTSTDSDRTPIRLDSMEERDSVHWPRQNSLSLKEWDIPFDDLKLLDIIGKGRFGTVHRGLWHGDVAVKVLKENYLDDERTLEAFKLEVATFKKTRHENLVLFMGACMQPPRLAIITSLCKGNTLFTLIHLRKDKFNLNRTTLVAQQISQGMGYLHARGIVHKDLKTKNIFLENGKVIITDFGLFSATKLQYTEHGLGIARDWLCYLAPELMRGLKPYRPTDEDLQFSKGSDVYAFGTVWYELLCGEFPFKDQPHESVIWQVGRGMKQTLANLQAARDVKDILMLCWAYESEGRPDFSKLLTNLERLPKKRLARSPSHPIQLSRSAESVF